MDTSSSMEVDDPPVSGGGGSRGGEAAANGHGGTGGSGNDDDDPVVRTIDVYLSTTLYEKLHLVQYPNRPFYRPYDLPVVARVKPKNHVLEMECDIPKAGNHYDEEAPRHLRIDRMKLESSFVDPLTTYAIGVIQGDDLHLTPVHGVFQMRPSTAHVDAAASEDLEMEGEDDDSGDEEKQQPQPVKLQHLDFKKQESKKALMAKRATWAYKKQLEEAEAWTDLQVHAADSHASANEFDKMFCGDMDREIKLKKDSGVFADMIKAAARLEAMGNAAASDQQLNVLTAAKGDSDQQSMAGGVVGAGGAGGRIGDGGGAASGGISALKGLEQVQATLERAGVLSFAQLLDLAGANASPIETLEHVKKVAVLVRGNWVRKSALYNLSPRLTDARDALLILLERYGGLNRFHFSSKLGVEEEPLLDILKGFAKLDKMKGMWHLKISDGVSFLSNYPAVAAQQARLWVEKEKELHSILSVLGKPECDYPGPVQVPTTATGGGSRLRGASATLTGGGGVRRVSGGGGCGGGGGVDVTVV